MIFLLLSLFLSTARADGWVDLPSVIVLQGSPPWSVSQFGVWTTGRTWTLSNSTDSVTSFQGDTWSVGRTWTLASGTDSVSVVQITSPWVTNISQFGGSNVVTGTGNSGAGIPRVTVSNDSSITNITGTITLPTGASTSANQSLQLTQETTTATNTTSILANQTNGTQQVQGNVASLSADSGNPVKIGAVYNTTMPSPATGQRVNAQANAFGELACRSRNKYLNMVGIVTTTLKSGPGVLHNLCINNGANATIITIYDSTTATGTKIGTPDVLGINTNVLRCLQYDAEFTTGLTIVSAGSAANDITVTYQ